MFFFLFFFVPAQRKGANEISSSTERPNSSGLPQTETGEHQQKANRLFLSDISHGEWCYTTVQKVPQLVQEDSRMSWKADAAYS